MTHNATMTAAGVPVTVTADDGRLTVTIGRFDPPAAGGLLHIEPRFGTATAAVCIADENGGTARTPGRCWFFDLYPAGPAAPQAGSPPPAAPDMTGTQRVLERAITETAADVRDDVILELGLAATFAGRILAALTSAGAIGRPVPYVPCTEDDLAYDGSDCPPRRDLTPRERDIVCRLIRDAQRDQRHPDCADLQEIADVITPRW
jgi:hypothetical protein